MYAVIFKAEIKKLDRQYSEMAKRMRSLAIDQYGCTEFVSVTEGKQEMAISYWRDLEDIKQWKENAEHLVAQELGRTQWYRSYHVQVVELIREYRKQA
ncbi:MAG: antibiotic biosynthesis monooxygenase [Gammaproteobacteria bacterium]|nr:antibiotic biosynthesis monooxygenase [Gammaproteobacteria bacterium]